MANATLVARLGDDPDDESTVGTGDGDGESGSGEE